MAKRKKSKKEYDPRGAIWLNKTRDGDKILSIKIPEEVVEQAPVDEDGNLQFVGFQNDYKTKKSHPSYNVLAKQEEEEDDDDEDEQPRRRKSKKKTSTKTTKKRRTRDEDDDEDDEDEDDDDGVDADEL